MRPACAKLAPAVGCPFFKSRATTSYGTRRAFNRLTLRPIAFSISPVRWLSAIRRRLFPTRAERIEEIARLRHDLREAEARLEELVPGQKVARLERELAAIKEQVQARIDALRPEAK